jgi:hypothetical protein
MFDSFNGNLFVAIEKVDTKGRKKNRNLDKCKRCIIFASKFKEYG